MSRPAKYLVFLNMLLGVALINEVWTLERILTTALFLVMVNVLYGIFHLGLTEGRKHK